MKIGRKSTSNFETKKLLEKVIIITKTLSNKHVMINIILNDRKLRIMLNLNASENFVAEKYTHYHNLFVRRKTIVYLLMSINESTINNKRVADDSTYMLKIDEHREKITLDIVDMINHDVILGVSLLRK